MKYSLPLFIASDHAGFSLKQSLKTKVLQWKWEDLGTLTEERTGYPFWAKKLCEKISPDYFGVLICGSGQGVCMTANRYPHIRASLCWNAEVAKMARLHNDSNVLCMGSRFISLEVALDILNAFMTTSFSKDKVYQNRIQSINS